MKITVFCIFLALSCVAKSADAPQKLTIFTTSVISEPAHNLQPLEVKEKATTAVIPEPSTYLLLLLSALAVLGYTKRRRLRNRL